MYYTYIQWVKDIDNNTHFGLNIKVVTFGNVPVEIH